MLELINVRMQGFKTFTSEKELILSGNTKIIAANGKGKTSIGDAVAYAFLGTDINGTENVAGRLLNNNSKDMDVTIDFEHNSKEHSLTRARKGSKTTIILDGNIADQLDLMGFIKNKELFLAIFSPTYFTSLTPKAQKDLLQRYLGEVSFDEVMAKMGTEGKDLLADNFKEPRMYIQRKRNRLVDIDERETYLKGFVAAKSEHEAIPEVTFFNNEQELEYTKLQAELEDLNSRPLQLHDISKQLQARDKLQSQITDLKGDYFKIKNKTVELEEEKTLSAKISKRESLIQQHASLSKQLQETSVDTVLCPNCQTIVELNKSFTEKLSEDIKKIVVEGKQVAADIKNLKEELGIKKSKQAANLNSELEVIAAQIDTLQKEMNTLDISDFEVQNSDHLKELNNSKSLIQDKLNKIDSARKQVATANSDRNKIIERIEASKKQIEGSKAEVYKLTEERESIKKQIEKANKFNSKRLQMQGEQISQYLDKVSIQFEKIVKSTGEVKDDFKIQYEEKDFNCLSTSERIKAGLEIANLLIKFSGEVFPVFVDNAESITEIPKMDTQVIAAYVVAGQDLIVAEEVIIK